MQRSLKSTEITNASAHPVAPNSGLPKYPKTKIHVKKAFNGNIRPEIKLGANVLPSPVDK